MRTLVVGLIIGGLLNSPGQAVLVPAFPPQKTLATLSAQTDFLHKIGQKGTQGWQVDYKKHDPGYVLAGLKDPLLLEPGLYRATFRLRRGNYPKKGLMYKAYALFRIEIWDVTDNEILTSRELQIVDFSHANIYEKRWIEFSMRGRAGHVVEPRVYWLGLANGEVADVTVDRFPNVDLNELEEKAHRLGRALENNHLENGFVVSRKRSGDPDEIGDATTYTGFYVASLAWKYGVTKDPLTYQALENGIQTLHKSIKGSDDHPMLTRYVDDEGVPYPKSPSKDVFTSFFLAYSVAYPFIKNKALQDQMKQDLDRVATRFLQDDLRVKKGDRTVMTLTPYITEDEIRRGLGKLFEKEEREKKILKALKQTQKYLPFQDPLPGMKKIIKAIKNKDEEALIVMVLPTMNALADLIVRARDILRKQYRESLFPRRMRNLDYPGRRLEILLTEALEKFPSHTRLNLIEGKRFKRLSDLPVQGGNALISLHVIRTALSLTEQPQFDAYYKTNLYTQDALLQSALDWFSIEENLVRFTAGNPSADRQRKGYLTLLSLYNLIQLETNPTIKERYKSLLKRWWTTNRNEDNPLAHMIVEVSLSHEGSSPRSGEARRGTPPNLPIAWGGVDFVLRGLSLFPENRKGFGKAYWKEKAQYIAETLGGGVKKGYSREPLPISHRPKGSFLWQRNARRLKGDALITYPGTDYLFVYWFSRYHNLIPPSEPTPRVKK